jgi:ribulose-5-phosphate 4-epimerase/fuculose-1-phosphate aldolase
MSELEDAIKEVSDACNVVSNAGLTELYAGHVSSRVGNIALIPAHLHHDGRGMESITPEKIIKLNLETGEQEPKNLELPEEDTIHTSIFNVRDDVKSCVHAHPLYATALSMTNTSIIPASIRAVRLGNVPIMDAGPRLIESNAPVEIARGEAVAKSLGNASCLLIRGHGVVTVGRTVAEAVSRLFILERAAKLQMIASLGGGAVAWEGNPYGAASHPEIKETTEKPSEDTYKFLRNQYLK